MHRLRRLQHRLSLTNHEAVALLTLSCFLIIGILARHLQQRAVPVSVGEYDELDRLFFERAARADSAALELDSDGAGTIANRSAPAAEDGDPASLHAGEATLNRREPGAAEPRVDINTADAASLETLPRIGPRTAERILAYRATYGPFVDVEDLQQIRGIGPKTIEQLKPLVRASSAAEGGTTPDGSASSRSP